ncbi:MAG: hypothetical protein IJQ80_01690 [Clostridia bacterium]|nr:hypothetical protein [Clostridia bacterium]
MGCGKSAAHRRHCLSAISPLDVFIYASRGEITKSTGVSLPLTQTDDFVFSLGADATASALLSFYLK